MDTHTRTWTCKQTKTKVHEKLKQVKQKWKHVKQDKKTLEKHQYWHIFKEKN